MGWVMSRQILLFVILIGGKRMGVIYCILIKH